MLQNSEYTVYCLGNQVSSQAVRRLKLPNKLGPLLSNHDKPQIQGPDLFLSGSKVGCGKSGKTFAVHESIKICLRIENMNSDR